MLLCATPRFLIPFLARDTKKDENRIRGQTGGPASTPFWRHTLVRGSKPFIASWRPVDRMGRSSSCIASDAEFSKGYRHYANLRTAVSL